MQVTIKGIQNTTHLAQGEVATVELTPFVRGLIRNGLAVQVPNERPAPVPATAPVKKAAAKRVTKKATDEPERVLGAEETAAFEAAVQKLDPEQE